MMASHSVCIQMVGWARWLVYGILKRHACKFMSLQIRHTLAHSHILERSCTRAHLRQTPLPTGACTAFGTLELTTLELTSSESCLFLKQSSRDQNTDLCMLTAQARSSVCHAHWGGVG